MLKIENKIGEKLDDYLIREYNHKHLSGEKIAGKINVGEKTLYNWLRSFNIPLRSIEDYIEYSTNKPPIGVLRYYYEHMRKPIKIIAKERNVNPKTIYRWMEKEGIERRHGSNAYLKKNINKPSNKKLNCLYIENKLSRKEIALRYGVHPETVGIWLRKARLSKNFHSVYDKKKFRKKKLDELLEKAEKKPQDLSMRDFKNIKQENGRSYYGILTWYISRFGYNFSKAKEHLIRTLYSQEN
ncbi:MAG: hypothetical protein Q7S27_03975 [Nanoarchaeota archaeon]|nr:hypothetical protein [Nanoarchaeota archaeon]